ncbi:MAG: hypothetical protein PVH68_17290 [Armatimonadota bacterium]|jgi:hypothetical protein
MDPYMKEIVDLAVVERLLLLLAVAAPVVAVAIGALAGARTCGSLIGGAKGLSVGILGPLCYALWELYSYLVRYDPATGYVGLHRVNVLALNAAIFVAVGVVLGVVYSRIFPGAPCEDTPSKEA